MPHPPTDFRALAGAMLRRGAPVDPAPPVPLRAGPLTLQFENDSLRYIRLGDRELVRRIYFAVRDRDWGTLPNEIDNVRSAIRDDSFDIEIAGRNSRGEIDFRWQMRITGDAEGTILCELEGQAHSSFWKNRIGFCVLHPIEGCAGEKCCLGLADGASTGGDFPRQIAAENPFRDITGIRQEIAPNLWFDIELAGDLFETEDQRNWTDASFKTFCTPLRLPFPAEVKQGERIAQRVTLRLRGTPAVRVAQPPADASVNLDLGSAAVGPVPQIGLDWTSHARPWSSREVGRLRGLSLSHFRVELPLEVPAYAAELSQAAHDARVVGIPLELAIFVSDNAAHELTALVRLLSQLDPPIARWQVFHGDLWSTPRQTVEAARRVLSAHNRQIPLGGGTVANFMEVNRVRPPADLLDFVTYSLHPQEHAFDDASLVETLAAQGATVESAKAISDGRPVVVGPITFKRRINPYATGPAVETTTGPLPSRVDPRQMSLFGAAWTLGSLKYLSEQQASAVTYYEPTGWLGVMERAEGSPRPDEFPSLPGAVFPLYLVLADVGEMKQAQVVPVRSADPLRVEALALRDDEKTRVLIVNLTGQPQRACLPTEARHASLRILDETTARAGASDPESFRARRVDISLAGQLDLPLAPFAFATVDLRAEGL